MREIKRRTLAEGLWTYSLAALALALSLLIGLVLYAMAETSPRTNVEVYEFVWPDGRPATLTIGGER